MEASRDWRATAKRWREPMHTSLTSASSMPTSTRRLDKLKWPPIDLRSILNGFQSLGSTETIAQKAIRLTRTYGDFECIFPKRRTMYMIQRIYSGHRLYYTIHIVYSVLIIVLVQDYTVYDILFESPLMCRCFIASPMHSHWSNSSYFMSLRLYFIVFVIVICY